MADEPSMDEILASLDRLLKEGEGRNDEPAEPLPQKPSGEQAEEQAEEPTQEPDPRFLMALDEMATETSNVQQNRASGATEESKKTGGNSEKAADARPRPDTPAASKRVVLTDSMMVSDVQQSLPLPKDDTTPAKPAYAGSISPKPKPAVAKPASAEPVQAVPWNERDIQALVDQVTDDVCSAIAVQLPDLIRLALAQRLASFVADRAQNQDSESKD